MDNLQSDDEHALYALPTAEELKTAYSLDILDAEGKKHSFQSLCENSDEGVERNLVILIRHWFCGVCQSYISHLTKNLPPSALSALPSPVRLTIIGCGSPELIPQYLETTSCPYNLYTDPTQNIYKTLNLGRTLDLGKKTPEYMEGKGMWSLSWKGAKQVLSTGLKARGGGDWNQIGGEFLFVKDKDEKGWNNTWAHRMKTTRDHAEIRELKKVLDME